MAKNPIERALGVWSAANYRNVMLPGLGVVTCGELCDAIAALQAENEEQRERLIQFANAFDAGYAAAERAIAERAGGVKVPIGYALVPVEPTDRMVSAYVAAKPKGAGFNHPRKGDDKKAWFAAHEKKCRERWKAMLSVSALTTEPAAPEGFCYRDENGKVQFQQTAPDGRQGAADWQRVDDALASCAGLLKALCRDEIGDTAAAELDYVRSVITRPSEQAVTEAMVEAGAKAIVACRFEDESEPVTDYDLELSRAALKAAMEAGRHD